MTPVIIRESEQLIKFWRYENGTSLPLIIHQYSEIYKWCKENCKNEWEIDKDLNSYLELQPACSRKFTYYFKNSQEALLFKLRWG